MIHNKRGTDWNFTTVALLILTCVLPLTFSETSFCEPLEDYILSGDNIAEFTIVKEPAYYRPESLWNYINGGALPYLDYGVGDVVSYSGRIGSEGYEIVVDIYDMADSLGAFGIYSNERFPEYDYLDIGVEGYLTENALSFWKDRYYIKIFSNAPETPSTEPIVTVAKALDKLIPDGGGMSGLFSLMPETDRLPKTESYLAKNVLGQDYLENACVVNYKNGDEEYQFYIMKAPDNATASEAFGKYRDFIGEYGKLEKKKVQLGDEVFVGKEDWYGLMVFARQGRYIVGSVGLSDFSLAKETLENIIGKLQE